MGRPKMYGLKNGFVPNSKADMRYQRNIYQRGREYTEKHQAVVQEIRERREMKRLAELKAAASRTS